MFLCGNNDETSERHCCPSAARPQSRPVLAAVLSGLAVYFVAELD